MSSLCELMFCAVGWRSRLGVSFIAASDVERALRNALEDVADSKHVVPKASLLADG
jgi:hypothetical protein